MSPPNRHENFEFREDKSAARFGLSGGCQMDLAPEDLRHRLRQLRFLEIETDDPLAERLVQDLIVELEDRLTAVPSPVKNSPG
jgi:hypothetical protein